MPSHPAVGRALPSVALAFALLMIACTPTTEAAASAEEETSAQVVIEAFLLESKEPIFDTSYASLSAAAKGDTRALLRTGSSGTLAERVGAAAESGQIDVLGAPSLMVRSGQSAFVQSGLQIPVQTVTADAVTVQFVNATLRLEVTSTVTGDGNIELEIAAQKRYPETSKVMERPPATPIQTTELNTRLMVADGGTAVMRGMVETRGSGTPAERGPELLVIVTPRIVRF